MTDLEVLPPDDDGDHPYRDDLPARKGQQRRRTTPCPPGGVTVHSEFHRLLGEFEDGIAALCKASADCAARGREMPEWRKEIESSYAAMHQRKKELYQWVARNCPKPGEAYALRLRF